MSKLFVKFSTTVVAVTTVVSLSGAWALPVANGATTAELQAQINALLSQISALQSQLAGSSVGSSSSCSFTRNLTVGVRGDDVKCLQGFLKVSPMSGFFGPLTKAAVAKWQSDNGVSPALGFFGSISRAKFVALAGGVTPPGVTPAPAPVPMGSGLTVTLDANQPASALAPYSAVRIPFTKVDLTASSDGDVVVNSLTVMRTGLGQDSAFSGVVLLDENGVQLGVVKTLSSDHAANVGEKFTVKAGTTRTVTVAANRAAAGSLGGQTAAFAVTAVNTSAHVNGTLPVTGTTHTVNESLTIGSVTVARGPVDPGASQTKNVGELGYTFSSVKVTAGSTERVNIKSVRWNQVGSAGSSDLANLQTYVDGVGYPVTVSADGKYFTTVFPGSGILMDKGFSKEVSIKGDINSGSSRTIEFQIAKRTDLYLVGETYGYGIQAPLGSSASSHNSAFNNADDPWYDGSIVTVNAGTITVSRNNAVQAQNVAVNLADQPLGGWTVEVKGEPISVANMKFVLQANQSGGSAAGVADLTSIKLVNDSGAVIAGPLDASGATAYGTITFTDTVVFPVGITNITMKGKLSTHFISNDTVSASTTPSSGWTTVTGQTTGNSITPSPTSAVTGNSMTVKAAAMTISVSAVPIAQTVIAGTSQFEFARYILDTSSSGEDLRVVSMPLQYLVPSGSASDLTNCKLYNGATLLTSGSNVVNPSAAASSTTFTFDGGGLTLTKGVSMQVSLKCDIKAAASGSYQWGFKPTAASDLAPTGLVSGQTVSGSSLTENTSAGQLMTAATKGSLTIALDHTAPYLIAAPGQTVELAHLKYSATNEDIRVKQVTLVLSSAASNTPTDLVDLKVSLWDGTNQIGTATFSSGDNATSSLIADTAFVVSKGGSRVLTVKGTINGLSSSGPLTNSGDLVVVNYDGGGGLTSNYGVGASSGQTISPTSGVTSSTGVRVMAAYPTLAQVTFTQTLTSQAELPLYKFSVTANNGDLNLYKMSFSVASSTAANSAATTSKFGLYAYTDSAMSQVDSQINTTGLVNGGYCYNGLPANSLSASGAGALGSGSVKLTIYPEGNSCNTSTTTFKIPSGSTRWFKLVASVGTLSPSGTSENLQVQLEGDAAYPTATPSVGGAAAGTMGKAATVNGDSNNDFIWSPRSTTSSTGETAAQIIEDLDWTNGYGVSGLPGTNMSAQTVSK